MEPADELIPGRFSDRFVAYLVDTLPFAIGSVLTIWAWTGPLGLPLSPFSLGAMGAAWVLAAVLWQFVGNLRGATPGKRLMGLRVVTVEGEAPGFARALVRALGWLLSTPAGNLGFLVALFHPRTRALHDLIAGTCVVEDGPRRSSGALVFAVAASAAVGLMLFQYWTNLLRPSREDLFAVAKANEAMDIVAEIQEKHKATEGVYASSVEGLANASGDPQTFKRAMLEVFAPAPFVVEGGNRRWRVIAAARDRRRTLVRREGP